MSTRGSLKRDAGLLANGKSTDSSKLFPGIIGMIQKPSYLPRDQHPHKAAIKKKGSLMGDSSPTISVFLFYVSTEKQ